MTRSPGRTGAQWRRASAAVLAADVLVCVRCHELIDKALPWPHTRSKSVDHLVALMDGGDPLDPGNLGPAHLGCNSRAGARRQAERQRARRDVQRWIADADP